VQKKVTDQIFNICLGPEKLELGLAKLVAHARVCMQNLSPLASKPREETKVTEGNLQYKNLPYS